MDAAVVPLLAALDGAAASPRDGSATLVRVVSLSGFGLRDSGDGAVVRRSPSGSELVGSVLGGLTDDAILEAAAGLDGRAAIRCKVTDADADAAGMVCGGSARILLSPIADLPQQLAERLRRAEPLVIVSPLADAGPDLVVTRKEVDGDPPSGADPLIEASRSLLAAGVTTSDVMALDEQEFLLSAVIPTTRFRVVGSGPMADAIVDQARLMGWEAETESSVSAAVEFVERAGPADGIAVLSHDPDVDVPILDAALGAPIGYIGGMGSRGTQGRRRTALGERGHDETAIARIHGPIGLDLGSRTPAETAVAIVAEFLAHRSGRTPGRLSDSSGPING